MTERGMVTELKDKLATIQLELQAACGACANDGCKKSKHALQAFNRDGLDISIGDQVEIEVEGKAQVVGALWVLGLPLATFVAGYFAARALFPEAAGEGPAALGGLLGLVLGGLVGMLVQRGNRLDSLPRVLRKVPARGPDEDEIEAAEAAALEASLG